jgi:hypothetical protein
MRNLLSFVADDVETHVEADSELYLVAFSVGDVEVDGHSWNFSRDLDDDSGVCTVREIQQATTYDGITSFNLHRSGLVCIFDTEGASEIGFSELQITFKIDDRAWKQLTNIARNVFRDRLYFTCDD